ncbi:MAG: hypothetical protein AAF660_07480 [Pseudomonadota bacterium]
MRSVLPSLLFAFSAAASASESVEIHAFSQVVHRGADISNDRPAVGISGSYDFQSGWFIGGGGYFADGEPSGLSLTRNLNAHIGYFRSLGNDSALEVSISRNEFIDVADWSYAELRGDWHVNRSFAVMLAYSPDYYGRAAAVNAGLTFRPTITDRAYLLASAGVGRVGGDIDTDIGWLEIGGGISAGRFDLSLSWNTVDNDSTGVFGIDRDSVALRVSYRLR